MGIFAYRICTMGKGQDGLVYGKAMAFLILFHAHAIFQLLLARGHHFQLLVISSLLGKRLGTLHARYIHLSVSWALVIKL